MTKTGNQNRPKTLSAGGKKHVRKKPKDKPKRPLSAYNYFFKTERQRILKFLLRNPDDVVPDIVVSPEEEQRLWTGGKKISFEEMGKLIGRRWKNIQGEKLQKYTKLATGDAERYQKELKVWNEKKEEEKKKAAEEMSLKNAQMMAMQSNAMANRGFASIPNVDFPYDASGMANGQSFNSANGAVYTQQNDPNGLSPYGQQMGMNPLQYNSYQMQKHSNPGGLYNSNQTGNNMPQAVDGNAYNNLYAGYGGTSNAAANINPYNSNPAQMQNTTSGPPLTQQVSNVPDTGNGMQDYYTQSGQMYGGSYQPYPSNTNQQWG